MKAHLENLYNYLSKNYPIILFLFVPLLFLMVLLFIYLPKILVIILLVLLGIALFFKGYPKEFKHYSLKLYRLFFNRMKSKDDKYCKIKKEEKEKK